MHMHAYMYVCTYTSSGIPLLQLLSESCHVITELTPKGPGQHPTLLHRCVTL